MTPLCWTIIGCTVPVVFYLWAICRNLALLVTCTALRG